MSRFFSDALASLTPYTPGEQPQDQAYNKLNTNECPYPPSARAVAAASAAAERLQLYPDPTCSELTRALAAPLGVNEDEILWGNGSDEILFFAFNAFCSDACPAVYPDITYGFYDASATLARCAVKKLPLRDDLTIDIDAYRDAGGTIFLANPNAPTGIALTRGEVETIVRANPNNVVVVDEAYVDFGAESAVPLIHKYDNLLIVQTFSKSRAMAGARLGMAIGQSALIRDLATIKYSLNPYSINRMTLAAGLGTLSDAAYTEECCARVMETRAYAAERLKARGFTFPESAANFLFAKHPNLDGGELYRTLKARGILVRHFDAPRIKAYNRITIGTRAQMDALFAALDAILEETP